MMQYEKIAESARKLRNALVHNGRFSHDEAIKIVAGSMEFIIDDAQYGDT